MYTADLDEHPAALRRRFVFVLALLAFLSLNLQTLSAAGHFVDDSGPVIGPVIKMYHVYFVALAGWWLLRGRVIRWRAEVTLYFLVVVFSGGVAYFAFGARMMLVNYLFAAYVVVIGATMGWALGYGRSLLLLRVGMGALLIAVLIKAAVYAEVLIRFMLMPNGHPILPFMYGGGPNLEASWIALGASLFIATRLFYPYCLASLAISMLYASRSSIVILALIIGVTWLRRWNDMRMARTLKLGMAFSAMLLVSVAVAGVTSTLENSGIGYVVERFGSIGHDPGSLGRITLWSGGIKVFEHHPFGVGQGNAILELERELGASLRENNVHNLFLQHLIDTGIQGFFAYVIFCCITTARLVRDRFRNPLLAFAVIYLVAGSLQFRGADAIFWFVYAMEMGSALASEGGTVEGSYRLPSLATASQM